VSIVKIDKFTIYFKFNTVKNIAILLLVLFPLVAFGQAKLEKIKGNKIIELKTQKVEGFNSLEVGDSFEVLLVLKSSPTVSIDADSNLHEHISVKVVDQKLIISADKTFTRFKRLFAEIGVNSKLTDIYVKGKVSLTSKNTLIPEKLNVETYESGKVNLEYKTANASFFAKNRSKIVANGETDILSVSANDSAEVEANAICKNFSASQNVRSELVLTGKAENSIFQIADNSFLNSANFVSRTTTLSTSGEAKSYVNIADKLTLEATGKTNTYILGNSLINLKVLKEEATIHKTNKAPSTLRSFLK